MFFQIKYLRSNFLNVLDKDVQSRILLEENYQTLIKENYLNSIQMFKLKFFSHFKVSLDYYSRLQVRYINNKINLLTTFTDSFSELAFKDKISNNEGTFSKSRNKISNQKRVDVTNCVC